ncbi:ABC transporter substrate-binding protein [Bacillus thuringiensis]|uniref:Ferrichrome ABC transporter substrate-binding protein n=1 Tax=Bacillus thuringiensis TaxID=1428 RepID=A0A9W3TJC0_BACTU|nr:ABC transporter substrate-binding protein [Bacillus thuringiensis]AQY42608.1 ferrichrome ABC transporter substrate-binding protein [Bacillus thuringiensis]MDR4150407.1 ABC transporter substrate-binding protein [Bacillus thuringiensis]MEC3574273.1 ABC transporter substrate-binding protein [Bacillus thuringiensis]MED2017133.1 ABC transporter substrate-binding protein [Bacillus thuringiensis]MED2145104.1 ABC transporter substrate-binding protein [Bacillus thuringiensis]
MKKFKMALLAMVLVVTSLLFAACSSNKEEEKKADAKAEERTVQHAKGEIKIPANPKKIADLSGSTEELLIFGMKPIITANTTKEKIDSHIEKKLKDVKPVGSAWGDKINIEAVAAAKPDLILVNNRQEKIYDQLSKIAPTVMLKTPLDQWRPKFEEVGQIFGKEKETKNWFKKYDEKASKLHDKIIAKTGDAKFMKMAAYPNAFRVYGDYGYGSVIFKDLKLPAVEGTPIDKPLVQVQKEALINYNPDYLFVFTTGDGSQRLKEFQEESIWKNMNAVKNNHVYTISNADVNKGYFPLGKEMILDEVTAFILGK